MSSLENFDTLTPAARSLLKTLAFFAPGGVEESILEKWPSPLPTQDFFRKAGEYRAARTELLQKFPLISHNAEEKELRVAGVVQNAVRARMSADEKAEIFWNAVCNVAMQWPSRREAPSKKMIQSTPPKAHSIRKWPKWSSRSEESSKEIIQNMPTKAYSRSDWPKGAPLYKQVLHFTETREPFTHKPTAYDTVFAGLLADTAWSLFEHQSMISCDYFYKAALDICEKSDNPDKASLQVDICLGFATVAAETKNHSSSLKYKQQALSIQLQDLKGTGIEDARLSRCYSELAIAQIQTRKYDDAVRNLLRGMKINTRNGSFSALTYANLGLVYTFQKNYSEAEKTLSFALNKLKAEFGKVDRKSFRAGRLLYAMGNLRAAQGRLAESEKYHEMALDQLECEDYKTNPRTADILHKMAEHDIRNRRYLKATQRIEYALHKWNVNPEFYQPEIARTRFLMAKLLKILGKYKDAKTLVEKATAVLSATAPQTGAPQTGGQPSSEDFDNIVTFWSR